jgi:hypothetical protein
LRRGNATSRAPIWSGIRKLKNIADSGITPRKIMVVPCIVNSWLYISGLTKPCSGFASCQRISSASRPPIRKKRNAVAPYRMPIRLWSTVVIQLHSPVFSCAVPCACSRTEVAIVLVAPIY